MKWQNANIGHYLRVQGACYNQFRGYNKMPLEVVVKIEAIDFAFDLESGIEDAMRHLDRGRDQRHHIF